MPPSPITSTSVYRPAMTVPIPSPVGTLAARGRGDADSACRGGIGIGLGERLGRPVGPVLPGRDRGRRSTVGPEPGRRDRWPVERAATLGVAGEQFLQPGRSSGFPAHAWSRNVARSAGSVRLRASVKRSSSFTAGLRWGGRPTQCGIGRENCAGDSEEAR